MTRLANDYRLITAGDGSTIKIWNRNTILSPPPLTPVGSVSVADHTLYLPADDHELQIKPKPFDGGGGGGGGGEFQFQFSASDSGEMPSAIATESRVSEPKRRADIDEIDDSDSDQEDTSGGRGGSGRARIVSNIVILATSVHSDQLIDGAGIVAAVQRFSPDVIAMYIPPPGVDCYGNPISTTDAAADEDDYNYHPDQARWFEADRRLASDFHLPANGQLLCSINQIHRYKFLELVQYDVPSVYSDLARDTQRLWEEATSQVAKGAIHAPNLWHENSWSHLTFCWTGRPTDCLSRFRAAKGHAASAALWSIDSYDDNFAVYAVAYFDLHTEGVFVTCDVPGRLASISVAGTAPRLTFQFVPEVQALTVTFDLNQVPGHFTSLKFGRFFVHEPPPAQVIHHLFIVAVVDIPVVVSVARKTNASDSGAAVSGVVRRQTTRQQLVVIRTETGARHRIGSTDEASLAAAAKLATETPVVQNELKHLRVVARCDLPAPPNDSRKRQSFAVRGVYRLNDDSDRVMAIVAGPIWYLYLITQSSITRVARFDGPTSAKCPKQLIRRE